MTIAVLDMPDTDESQVPLAVDSDDLLAGAIILVAERVGARRTAVMSTPR